MKVLTLNTDSFAEHCRRLETTVSESFVPDIVIGIANGGVNVAAHMFESLPHHSVSLKRPSTLKKNRMNGFFSFVRSLPLCVRNGLRIVEARMLSLKKNKAIRQPDIDVSAFEGTKSILVVDDAVDSGATLQAVLNSLASLPGRPQIKSAVITTTTRHPLVNPDYTLYNNRTLIRFPWSKDYRPEK